MHLPETAGFFCTLRLTTKSYQKNDERNRKNSLSESKISIAHQKNLCYCQYGKDKLNKAHSIIKSIIYHSYIVFKLWKQLNRKAPTERTHITTSGLKQQNIEII